jgi:Predicted endonuclease containing a URI domain
MSFWVYILRCGDGSYYTGHTDNLEVRIAQHKTDEIEGYTSTRLPVRLMFSEQFATREEALTCELQIKGWNRKKKEALMRRDWSEISQLAHRNYSDENSLGALRLSSGRTVKNRTETRK